MRFTWLHSTPVAFKVHSALEFSYPLYLPWKPLIALLLLHPAKKTLPLVICQFLNHLSGYSLFLNSGRGQKK